MEKYFLLLIFILISCLGRSQDYFNLRERYEHPVAIHTGVIVQDTQFITISVVADSISPYNGGLGLTVYDYDGMQTSQNFHFDELNEKMSWYPNPIFQNDHTLLLNGILEDEDFQTLYYLGKLDLNNLELIWEKTYPWPDEVFFFQGRGMAQLNDKIYFANRLIYEGQQENIGLQIIDLEGNLVKNQFIQLSDWGRVQTIETWGNIIVLGGARIIGTPETLGYKTRNLLVGIDSSGNKLWEWVSPAPFLRSLIFDMIVTDEGSIVICSSEGVEIPINSSSSAIQDTAMIIYELNSNRQIIWETKFTEPTVPTGFNNLRTLHKCKDGSGYIAGGTIYREGPDQTGDVLGYLAKVSTSGDSLWTRKIQYFQDESELDSLSKFEHIIYDLDETSTGDILIAGEAFEQTSYPQQAWLMKVDSYGCLVPGCHLVDAVSTATSHPNWLISPNPTTDRLHVQLGDFNPQIESQLVIFDLQGNLIKRIRAAHPNTSYSIGIESLPNGPYIISWTTDGQVISTDRFIKT